MNQRNAAGGSPSALEFAAALECLDRCSAISLLEQLAAHVREHCEKIGLCLDHDADISAVLTALRQKSDSYRTEIDRLSTLLRSLQNDLPADIEHTLIHNKELRQAVLNKTDASHLIAHINDLNDKLLLLQGAARQLNSIELDEIQKMIERMMLKMDMHTIFSRTKLKVNGTDFELAALLHVLLTADQVADVQISYSPHDLVEIIEVVFVLIDETRIIFRPSTPSDDPFAPWHANGHCSYIPDTDRPKPIRPKPLIYLFVTNNWKGVRAQFRLMFKPRPISCLLCGRTLTQDFYDGVEQSNIIFDLHPQVTELLV
jgi:hypothetical protein